MRGNADGGGGAGVAGMGVATVELVARWGPRRGRAEREGVSGVRRLGGGLDRLGELELEGEVGESVVVGGGGCADLLRKGGGPARSSSSPRAIALPVLPFQVLNSTDRWDHYKGLDVSQRPSQ